MIGPINPDRFDALCQAERRIKFLERYIRSYGRLIFYEGCNHLALPVGGYGETLGFLLDRLMVQHPELLEETTEVK